VVVLVLAFGVMRRRRWRRAISDPFTASAPAGPGRRLGDGSGGPGPVGGANPQRC